MDAIRNLIIELIKGTLAKYDGYTDIKSCINAISDTELKKITINYDIVNSYKKEKDEIIDEITQKLDEQVIYNHLLQLDDNLMKIVNYAYKNRKFKNPNSKLIESLLVQEVGILYVFVDGEGNIINFIPDEVRSILDIINNDIDKNAKFRMERKRCQLVKKYLNAFLNLYGVIEKDYFFYIFNKQNKVKLKKFEYINMINCIVKQKNQYHIIDKKIVDKDIYMQYFDLQKTLSKAQYCEFSKDEYMKYSDRNYIDMNEQQYDLLNYLISVGMEEREATEFIVNVCNELRKTNAVQNTYFFMKTTTLQNEYYDDVKVHIAKINKNIRKWANKGYTINEVQNFDQYLKTEFDNFTSVC